MNAFEDAPFEPKVYCQMLSCTASRKSCFLAFVCLASAIPVFSPADEPPAASSKPMNIEFVRAVLETALEHHIEPPTRQQLILEFLRHVTSKLGHPLSRNLASQISDIANVDELYHLLQRQLVECHFYDSAESEQLLIGGLQLAMAGSVRLVPHKEQLVSEQMAANRYVGIGIQIAGDMKVASAFEGGPAHEAGLQAHDVIEAIDGKPTKGEPLAASIERLRGPVGTSVTVMARTPGQVARELVIERRVVPFKTVERLEGAGIRDDLGVIKVLQITASTVIDLTKLIDDMPQLVDTVVIDASRATVGETNIGLHSVHLLADALLDECELGQLESRTGTRKLRAEEGNILSGRKLIFYYVPRTHDYIDWLAANLNSQGHFVGYEKNAGQFVRPWDYRVDVGSETKGAGAYESYPVNDDYYITLMSNWLTANTPRGQAVVDLNQLIQKPAPAVKP